MFQVGDKVVYPNHGVGVITAVTEYVIGGNKVEFFEVNIIASKSTVKVPAGNAMAVGLRPLLSKEDIENVFAYMRSDELVTYDDWKERFKLNSDLMRTGKVDDMACVLKNLHFLSLDKPLSFREKRMYERSFELIIGEIAEVRKSQHREVEESLLNALAVGAEARGLDPHATPQKEK